MIRSSRRRIERNAAGGEAELEKGEQRVGGPSLE
jgi:hypothetical protein